ncbi:MAG: hypothetical protein J6125_04740 [Clostridia bacterium]|nr:hypothetical protein [Clostridia bacterium]
MKIDRDALSALCALDDKDLWAALVRAGESKGLSLPAATPPHEEMEKIRALLRSPEKTDPTEAMKLLRRLRGR